MKKQARKTVSIVLAILMALSVVIPVIATPAKAAGTHKCKTYQLTPAEKLIIQKKADEFLSDLQDRKTSANTHYVIDLPDTMIAKYGRSVLRRMIEITARKRTSFLNGRYAQSQFSLHLYDAPHGCGFIFEPLLSDAQMKQTEDAAQKAVTDLKNSSMSEKAKVQTIYNRLEKICSYDNTFATTSNEISETAYGALIRHKAVCCGASMALSLMCYYAGIQNVSMEEGYLYAQNRNYGSHAWNTYFDGKTKYLIDIVNHHCLEQKIKDCTYTNYIAGDGTYFLEVL